MFKLPAVSDRRDGGRGMAILLPPEVGVGICLLSLLSAADEGVVMSPTSEKISPRSA